MSNNRVLIVDDDEDIRRAVRMICEFQDLDVIGEAADGKEAIQLVARFHPDFVILDYMMPNMNGELVAEVIRAYAPATRIVAFSAILEEQPHWADGFLSKKDVSELPDLLERMAAS